MQVFPCWLGRSTRPIPSRLQSASILQVESIGLLSPIRSGLWLGSKPRESAESGSASKTPTKVDATRKLPTSPSLLPPRRFRLRQNIEPQRRSLEQFGLRVLEEVAQLRLGVEHGRYVGDRRRLNRAILFEKFMESLAGGKPQIVTTAKVATCEALEHRLQLRVGLIIAFLDHVAQWRRKRRIYFSGERVRAARPRNRAEPRRQIVSSPSPSSWEVFCLAVDIAAATGKAEQQVEVCLVENAFLAAPKFLL